MLTFWAFKFAHLRRDTGARLRVKDHVTLAFHIHAGFRINHASLINNTTASDWVHSSTFWARIFAAPVDTHALTGLLVEDTPITAAERADFFASTLSIVSFVILWAVHLVAGNFSHLKAASKAAPYTSLFRSSIAFPRIALACIRILK